MPERNPMTAVGDTVTVKLGGDVNGTVTGAIGGVGHTAVGDTTVLELSANEGQTWEQATLNKPDQTTRLTLVGSGVSGWCEAPSYTHARLRLTVLTSGAVVGRLNWRKG